MAAYWPSFCVFMDRDKVKVPKNAKKKKKKFAMSKGYSKELRFCGNNASNPERAR